MERRSSWNRAAARVYRQVRTIRRTGIRGALGDEIVVRLNPRTNEVENGEILFYAKRLKQTNDLILPFFTEMRLAA